MLYSEPTKKAYAAKVSAHNSAEQAALKAKAQKIAMGTGKTVKVVGNKIHFYHAGSGEWREYLHPRGHGGKFAKKPGGALPHARVKGGFAPNVATKGKQAPANWKFYKPGYKPKGWESIKGHNAKRDGLELWNRKKVGEFANDYEFWLAAQKLAASHKKKHPNGDNASLNQIVNAAFRHELEETGDVKLGAAPKLAVPEPPTKLEVPKHTHGKTAGGMKIVSKHAPPGTLTEYVKTMPGASGAQPHSSEDEMILPPGMAYRVLEVRKGTGSYGNEVLVEVVDTTLPEKFK